jgi:general secretion pathway protein G
MKTLASSPSRTLRAARAGFSLAELMVVIVILGLLATIVVPNVMRYLFTASDTVARADISAIVTAVESYQVENGGKAPDTLDVLQMPDENGNSFLKKVPLDPWKNPYVYEPPSGGKTFRVISYGADGLPGGEGKDADITSETILER